MEVVRVMAPQNFLLSMSKIFDGFVAHNISSNVNFIVFDALIASTYSFSFYH